jgi:hypothetical protein
MKTKTVNHALTDVRPAMIVLLVKNALILFQTSRTKSANLMDVLMDGSLLMELVLNARELVKLAQILM